MVQVGARCNAQKLWAEGIQFSCKAPALPRALKCNTSTTVIVALKCKESKSCNQEKGVWLSEAQTIVQRGTGLLTAQSCSMPLQNCKASWNNAHLPKCWMVMRSEMKRGLHFCGVPVTIHSWNAPKCAKEAGTQNASEINSFKHFGTLIHNDHCNYIALLLLRVTRVVIITAIALLLLLIHPVVLEINSALRGTSSREVNGREG